MKGIGSEPGGVGLNTFVVETSSDFMETLLGTNLFGTIMQVSKKLPFLTPLAYLAAPLNVIKKVGKPFRINSEEVQRRIDNNGNTKPPDFMDYMLLADSLVLISKKLKLKIYIEQVALQMFIAGFDPVQLVFFPVYSFF
ncbi:hypothetical protein F4824DRAFT_503836 [Ustulina deusta]|nr:hypothetical protein F4824DRAFT_503836 [Ustulina deusta]